MTRARSTPLLALAAALALAPLAARATTPFTARDLAALARVGDPQLSPDGSRMIYDVRTTDFAADKGIHTIWINDVAGGAPRALAPGGSARFGTGAAAGEVLFIAPAAGIDQVWRLDPAHPARAPRQVTALAADVQVFRLSRDGRTLVVAMAVLPGAETPKPPPAGKATGVVYDKLFVRHWDAWADGTRNHLFALKLDEAGVAQGAPIPLMAGFDGDVPSKPSGGDDDFALSPDGASVVFSARLAGRTEPWSTNFDLWRAPIDGAGAPVDLTADNLAWDAGPVFSPDGRTLAWRAMRRPGFEADRFTVWLMDVATRRRRELTASWDRSPGALRWTPDGAALIATADDAGTSRLFAIDVATGAVRPLTDPRDHAGGFDVGATGAIVYTSESFAHPATLARTDALGAPPAPISGTDPNSVRLADAALSEGAPYAFVGWNGETVHGWVFKPYGWVAGRKYPVAFLIHGGPQGSWGNGWSYRWSPQVFAGAGYAVVLVDFHGSTGYGQAFTDSISGHWGDRPLEDLQKGWAAALAQNAFLDGDRACALGASYGGFMVNWIAGVWNAPWKCLVTHDGVFDDRSMGYSTEELWFSEWEHGHKTPWADPAAYERFNPVAHVADWIRPQLIIHGGRDFRIPLEQGLAAFGALQRKGVESRFLYFPDENHWVLKPADALLWNATVLGWLDAHLKG